MDSAYTFERKVLETILRYHMLSPGQTVLAAVSGGADSVCLLTVLKQLEEKLQIHLSAVHVEHGIRGEESLGDAHFVQQLCESYGVPLTVRYIRVVELAEMSKRTLEEEARLQRYRIFRDTARQLKADRVAVAHNRKDQAETVLWNLVRGSGIRGLAGIRPVRSLEEDILVVRPLLEVSRQQIESYLQERGIGFRTDRTNLDPSITRNRIRLQILPDMEKLNSCAESHIAETAESLAQIEDYLEKVTEKACSTCIRDGVLVLKPYLEEERIIQRRILRECIRRMMPDHSLKDIGQVHVDSLQQLALSENGKSVSLPGGVMAVREEGIVRFTAPSRQQSAPGRFDAWPLFPEETSENDPGIVLKLPFEGEKVLKIGDFTFRLACGRAVSGDFKPAEKQFTKLLAYDTITVNEDLSVCLRARRPGDFLVSDAGGGRKKLSDYLIDCKVPRRLRSRLVLLAQGSHILWVAGGRISEGAKVSPGGHFLKVECQRSDGAERCGAADERSDERYHI